MDTQTSKKIADCILTELSSETALRIAIVYGSFATGRLRSRSDIDIAVLFDRPMTVEQKESLVCRLTSRLARDVDLIDLSGVSGVILKEILCKGKVLVKNCVVSYDRLVQRMIYNQTDMMPYYERTLRERVERFAYA